jgi:hypothetical protein
MILTSNQYLIEESQLLIRGKLDDKHKREKLELASLKVLSSKMDPVEIRLIRKIFY